MMNTFSKSLKILALCLVIGFGAQIAFSAWGGAPGNPPSNNKAAPINVTSTPQGKGGTPTSGSLLDIHGLLAANQLGVAGDSIFGDQVMVLPLSDTTRTTPEQICADSNGTLVLCGTSGPTGNTQIYTMQGTSQYTSGPCTICMANTFYVDPSLAGKTFTVKVWGAGGGGGAGSVHTSASAISRDGAKGGDSTLTKVGQVVASAVGGEGGKGGRKVCSTPSICASSLVNTGGVGGLTSGTQTGQDGDDGSGMLASSNPKIGGAGGGGGAGEYKTYTLNLTAGATYVVTLGVGGSGGTPSEGDSTFNGISDVCGGGGGNGSQTTLKDFLIKTAYATGVAANGGLGGVPSSASGTYGKGGDGGSADNCGSDTSLASGAKANSGNGGFGGRMEISWN